MAFRTMADYLTKLESSPEDWHLAPIWGHTRFSKLYPLYPAEAATLEVQRLTTVSQLFDTHLSGRIDKSISPEIMAMLAPYPMLQHKLNVLVHSLLKQPFHNKFACPRSNLAILAKLDVNLSRRYRIKNREILDNEIGVAPSYRTRIRDGLAVRPSQRDFTNAYTILRLPMITSKTRETAFQILNRTIWTNNKAYKSRMRADPHCERCKKVETMEHLLCECEYYSEPLWDKLAKSLTTLLNNLWGKEVPRIELGQINVIFNIPHQSILLHIKDKASRNAVLLLIQEIKRDIIYRRMNLPPSASQVTDSRRLAAHLDSVIRRVRSYLQYIGLQKFKKAADMLLQLQEYNLVEWINSESLSMSAHNTSLSHADTNTCGRNALHTQHIDSQFLGWKISTCTPPPQKCTYCTYNTIEQTKQVYGNNIFRKCIYYTYNTIRIWCPAEQNNWKR